MSWWKLERLRWVGGIWLNLRLSGGSWKGWDELVKVGKVEISWRKWERLWWAGGSWKDWDELVKVGKIVIWWKLERLRWDGESGKGWDELVEVGKVEISFWKLETLRWAGGSWKRWDELVELRRAGGIGFRFLLIKSYTNISIHVFSCYKTVRWLFCPFLHVFV